MATPVHPLRWRSPQTRLRPRTFVQESAVDCQNRPMGCFSGWPIAISRTGRDPRLIGYRPTSLSPPTDYPDAAGGYPPELALVGAMHPLALHREGIATA